MNIIKIIYKIKNKSMKKKLLTKNKVKNKL